MKFIAIILFIVCSVTSHARVYYLSENGNNTNNGLSPQRPLKTINELIPGNTYLLKRGDTFYLNFACNQSNTNGKTIVIAAYGQGDKPIVSTYKNLKNDKWNLVNKNVWKINILDSSCFTGFNKIANSNVGHVKINGSIWGNKYPDVNSLSNENDFYSDSEYLYMYFKESPRLLKYKIQVACDFTIIKLEDNMKISNLKIIGTGGHAINGTNKKNVYIDSLEINSIGGSYLFPEKHIRYGNGIQFWKGASNCSISNCMISQVYDAAITLQGNGDDIVFKDVSIKSNHLFQNEQSFEFWIDGKNGVFKNCIFSKNNCENAGMGWSHKVRIDKIGVHVLNYFVSSSDSGMVIENNVFKSAVSGYMFFPEKESHPLFKSFNNRILLTDSIPIRARHTETQMKNYQNFINTTNLEKGSIFIKNN